FTLHFILSISQGIRGHRYVLPFPTRRSSDLAKVTDSIPISEGDKWILLDVTLTDVDGSDYSIDEFAILYGDFILLDDEDNIYYSYNKGNKVPFNNSVRDVVLFNVPTSKYEFLLFSNNGFDNISDLNRYTRELVEISLEK